MYSKKVLMAMAVSAMWFTAHLSWAGTVRLGWDPNRESALAGYKLYYGNSPRTQAAYAETIVINDRNATAWEITLAPGVYYFALRAFDANDEESGFSNEIMAEIPDVSVPGQPGKPTLDQ